jgi:pimeloyl-ACP methyl ester carboxylesterase
MRRRLTSAATVAAVLLTTVLSACAGADGSSGGDPSPGSGSTPSTTTSTTASGGRLVQVGGLSIYLECHGTGSPTLVLQSGFGNSGDIWNVTQASPPTVEVGLARTNRVCVYDRPGSTRTLTDGGAISPVPLAGRSDQTPMPRTALAVVAELHGLLEAAAVPGPYVLVGHSLGGLFNLLYARTYPDQVTGLVMVDATPPALVSLLPSEAAATLRDGLLHPTSPIPDYRYEAYDLDVLLSQLDAAPVLRPVPAVLLTADTPQPVTDAATAAMTAATAKVLPEARSRFQASIPGSNLQPVPGASHYIQVDRPDVVIEAVRSIL